MSGSPRTGIGYDSHRFLESGGRLVLGGVEIPGERGLAGHSDADVVSHALIDAVLGAAGLGDIGDHFPDRRSALGERRQHRAAGQIVAGMLTDEGWRTVNADVTVIAERPRLARSRRRWGSGWRAHSASSAECVNVKATTNEGMGFVGRGEGIAVLAVATLERTASDA